MHIHLSCAHSPTAVPHCLLRACAGRPGLSPSTTPGLRKALDFAKLSLDPFIQDIKQYITFVPFEVLQNEAERKLELAQEIHETAKHDRSVLNPPECDRTYSTTYDNDALGTGHGRSMLNSPQAWSPAATEQAEHWMQINAGTATTVFGVRNQPSAVQNNEKVTAFTVQYSIDASAWDNTDDSKWSDVDGGRTFTDPSGSFDALFVTPVTAQYIRITVQRYVKFPSMRAGLLTYLTDEERKDEERKEAEEFEIAAAKMIGNVHAEITEAELRAAIASADA